MLITWCVEGDEFEADRFVDEFKLRHRACLYRQGEAIARNRAHKTSGFRVTVSEKDHSDAAMADVVRFLAENRKPLMVLQGRRATHRIEVLLGVGTRDTYARELCFAPPFLEALARANAGLSIVACLCSDSAGAAARDKQA